MIEAWASSLKPESCEKCEDRGNEEIVSNYGRRVRDNYPICTLGNFLISLYGIDVSCPKRPKMR
jgi:hypothetical protein